MTTKVTSLNIDATTITAVGTLTSLSVAGNVTAGNASLGNLVTSNYFSGTLTTAEQPNITSTGTLTNLTVTGNVTFSGQNVSLGTVGNAKITGGTNGQYLTTDGTGNLSFTTVSIPTQPPHPFLFLGI